MPRKRSAATDTAKRAPRRSEQAVDTPEEDLCVLPAPMDEYATREQVVALCQMLQTQGVAVPTASMYDAATRRGVQRLQRQMRPVYDGPIDGLWTARTRTAACGLYT